MFQVGEAMSYTIEDTPTIFWGDHADFPNDHVHEEMGDARRWGHDETRVFQHRETAEYWAVSMYIMSGDSGEHHANAVPYHVHSREVIKIVWEPVS